MATLKDLGEFGRGVIQGAGSFVKPYVSLIGEAGYQGGRYLIDPTFRKAIRAPESLSMAEIEKVNRPRQTRFLTPQQLRTKKQTIKTGAAATGRAELAAIGLANPITALTTAGLAGGLTYGAQKITRQPTDYRQIGLAVGKSPVYAGVGRLTTPIQGTLASYFSKGLETTGLTNVLLKGGIRGTSFGGFNVLENYLTTPLLEGRQPTKQENVLAFAIGVLGGAGEEGFRAIKDLKVKKAILEVRPELKNDPGGLETATGTFIRNEIGQFSGFIPKNKFIKDPYITNAQRIAIRKKLGLPTSGLTSEDLPFGLQAKPKGGMKAVFDIELARKNIANIKTKTNLKNFFKSQEISPNKFAYVEDLDSEIAKSFNSPTKTVIGADRIAHLQKRPSQVEEVVELLPEAIKQPDSAIPNPKRADSFIVLKQGTRNFGVVLEMDKIGDHNFIRTVQPMRKNLIQRYISESGRPAVPPSLPENLRRQPSGNIISDVPTANTPIIANKNRIARELSDFLEGKLVDAMVEKPRYAKLPETPTGLKERGFIKTVKEAETTAPEVAEQVKGFYKPIPNVETIQRAQFTIDTQGWDAAKKQAISGPQTAENTAIGLELMRRAQNAQQYDEAIDIAQQMAAKGTTAGQVIQAFSIWGRMTPEGMLRYAAKEVDKANLEAGFADKVARKLFGIKAPKLTSDDAAKITDLMKKANATESEETKAQLVRQALEVINDKIPYGISELIDTYRYNNMLSNPLTHLRNFTSNALQTFLTRPLTKLVSGDIKGTYKYYGGLYKGWDNAVSDAQKAFKGEIPLEKPDIRGLRQRKAPGILTVPTKTMEASDRFFQALIKNAEIAGGKSSEEASRITKYSLFRTMLDPSGDKTGQGYLLRGIDSATQGFTQFGKKFPLVRWFVPFIQTPIDASKQWLEYSPAGIATIPGAQNKAEQIAKTLIGSVITMAAGKIAFDGRTTWSAPTDPEQKDLFYASGKKPFSIKVGDNWVPMQTFGVFAFPIALAAAAKNYQEDTRTALTDTQMEKLSKTLFSQIEFFSGATFMEGLGNLVGLTKGDKDYSLAGNIAFTSSQFIPFTGLASYVARLIDPVYRKPQGETMLEKAGQTIARGIPFASKRLTPYEKPGGELETRNITDYIAPYATGKEDIKYITAFELRGTRLQENAVLNKELKKYDDTKSRVLELLELGNEQKARQLVRENKDVFQRGLLLNNVRTDVRKWQDMREQVVNYPGLTNEQKQKLMRKIEKEIKSRLELFKRF